MPPRVLLQYSPWKNMAGDNSWYVLVDTGEGRIVELRFEKVVPNIMSIINAIPKRQVDAQAVSDVQAVSL